MNSGEIFGEAAVREERTMESAVEVVTKTPIAVRDGLVSLTSLSYANSVCVWISCSTDYLCSKEILEYFRYEEGVAMFVISTVKRFLSWTCPRGSRQTSHGLYWHIWYVGFGEGGKKQVSKFRPCYLEVMYDTRLIKILTENPKASPSHVDSKFTEVNRLKW